MTCPACPEIGEISDQLREDMRQFETMSESVSDRVKVTGEILRKEGKKK